MDQIANWVRFADTKATILTAGLGIFFSMLMANAKMVGDEMRGGCTPAFVLGVLAILTLFAFLWTLYWLVRAITPRTGTMVTQFNRFAWPSLLTADTEQVIAHAEKTDVRVDAWRQVLDLAKTANQKFDACRKAVNGFAFFAVLGMSCVVVGIGFSG
jgi:hypothetical protein